MIHAFTHHHLCLMIMACITFIGTSSHISPILFLLLFPPFKVSAFQPSSNDSTAEEASLGVWGCCKIGIGIVLGIAVLCGVAYEIVVQII